MMLLRSSISPTVADFLFCLLRIAGAGPIAIAASLFVIFRDIGH
jgi:hypothetical protein